MPTAAKSHKTQQWVHGALEDARAQDIAMLDVRKISDFTDFMVIATGTSNRHVQSTADKIVDMLREHGVRPMGVEGQQIGDWVLIDLGDVVVHVMRAQTRDFYNLEKLWSDAKRVAFGKHKETAKTSKSPRKPKTAKK